MGLTSKSGALHFERVSFSERSKSLYSLRRLMMNKLTRVLEGTTGSNSNSQLRRAWNIINQTDPEELFGHLSEEKVFEQLVRGKNLPDSTYLNPDSKIFSDVKRIMNNDLHHGYELDFNQDMINSSWTDDELKIFHDTLREADEAGGSGPRNLWEFTKYDHVGFKSRPGSQLDSAHGGNTKEVNRAIYTQSDPVMRAAEAMAQNESRTHRLQQIEDKASTKTNQIKNEARRVLENEGINAQFDRGTRGSTSDRALAKRSGFEKLASPLLKFLVEDGKIKVGAEMQLISRINDTFKSLGADDLYLKSGSTTRNRNGASSIAKQNGGLNGTPDFGITEKWLGKSLVHDARQTLLNNE